MARFSPATKDPTSTSIVDPTTNEVSESCQVALRPLCREFLKSGMSAQQFLQAAKLVYVQVAIAETTRPNAKPNVSRIAAATGLSRREISALIEPSKRSAVRATTRPVDQPVVKVLKEWRTNPRFLTKKNQPRNLSLDSSYSSFQGLVRCCAGDVTPMAVLRELERVGAIQRLKENRVQLVKHATEQTSHQRALLSYFSRQIADQANALGTKTRERSMPIFSGSREVTNLNPDLVLPFLRSFAERANGLLETFDHWVERRTSKQVPHGPRVGIGIYLVHDSIETDAKRDLPSGKVRRGRTRGANSDS